MSTNIDEPLPPWSEELGIRFVRAGFLSETMKAWWCDEHLAGPENDPDRLGYLARLREIETRQGPPTIRELDRRLQIEAELDPDMPKWIRRPWFIPREHMLAAEAILVEVAGFGYSASGMSFVGEDHVRNPARVPTLDLVVSPVPGMLSRDRAAREAARADAIARFQDAGIPQPRLMFWNDAEPAKAFHGMLAGRTIRLGHIALGIPYQVNYGVDGEL